MQPWWLQLKNEIHRFKYSSGYMQELFNEFRLLIARHKSAEGDMSANKRCTSRLRTFSVVAELNNLAKTTRLTSDLASLTLESSLSLSSRNATYGHTPFPIADERIIHQKSPGRSTPNCYLNGCALERDMTRRRVPKGPSWNLTSQEMQALQFTKYRLYPRLKVCHIICSVAGNTSHQEWIMDSGAWTQTTRDETLLSESKPSR